LCHAMAGDFDEAIAFQNKAIELAPDDQKQPLKVIAGEFEQAKQNAAQAATKDTSSDPKQPAGAGTEEKPPAGT